MENQSHIGLQAKIFDFALTELVIKHRESFVPLWTIDSWVKYLIWLALNCGLSGERESLELFADAVGAPLNSRMRRLFFERTLDHLSLKLLGDPAENKVLVLPLAKQSINLNKQVTKALEESQLADMVSLDIGTWEKLDGVIAIPWKDSLISTSPD